MYIITIFLFLKFVSAVVFLENSPFDGYEPDCQYQTFCNGDFHHHEHLRIAVNAEIVSTHAVGIALRHEDGEHLVAEQDEQQRAEAAEYTSHP